MEKMLKGNQPPPMTLPRLLTYGGSHMLFFMTLALVAFLVVAMTLGGVRFTSGELNESRHAPCVGNICIFDDPSLPQEITCSGNDNSYCSQWVPPCERVSCYHGGTCKYDGHGDIICLCPSNHWGRLCDNATSESVNNTTNTCRYCFNGGRCLMNGTTYTCQCPSEWTGNHCQQIKVESVKKCEMQTGRLPTSLENGTWYEVSRTKTRNDDACFRYDFSLDNTTLDIGVSLLQTNRFSADRRGKLAYNISASMTGNNTFILHGFPHVRTWGADVHASMSMSHNLLVFHACVEDQMYGTQNFISVLARSPLTSIRDKKMSIMNATTIVGTKLMDFVDTCDNE